MPPKRKRNERGEGGGRPPPYRPGDTGIAQHDRDDFGSRPSKGGSRGPRRPDRRDSRENFNHRPNQRPEMPARPPISSGAFTPAGNSAPTSTSALTPTIPPVPPSPAVANYSYDVVTSDKIAIWGTSGRQLVIDHGIQSRQDEDITELSTIYQEVIRSVFDRRLDALDAGSCIKDIIGPIHRVEDAENFGFNPPVLFLDTLSIFLDGEASPYPSQLKEFMAATEIPPRLMRRVLDANILQTAGLLRDTFTRMAIRTVTNLLYRQANYNLLREETEGYSKLATELFATTADFPSSTTARMTFERIKALVGTFDLDVGRVLDVTLDVAASMLIRNFKFFVKLFRVSSWWPREQVRTTLAPSKGFVGGLPLWALPDHFNPHTSPEERAEISKQQLERDIKFWNRAREVGIDAFYELGGRQVIDEDLKYYVRMAAEDEMAAVKLKWIEETKTLPPPGNRVAAQLLGFKLRFYQSDARGEKDIFPPNLSYLAALLIKIGFISLCDLYPHLYPSDEDMESIRERQMKLLEEEELRRRPGGGVNALMMAGALPDDAPPAPPSVHSILKDSSTNRSSEAPPDMDKDKPKYKEPLEQKAQLLQDLLTIGAIPEALFFLGQFPWLFDAFPKVAQLIHRIIHYSIDKLAMETMPFLNGEHQCPGKKPTEASAPIIRKWANPDDPDHQGRAHRFYWDEWSDNIPVCQTVDDLFTLCDTFLNISGVNIGQDAALLTKICRIGGKSLQEDTSESNYNRWRVLLSRLLVPALSLTKSNSSVTNAVWDILQRYPKTVRFGIYAEWFEGPVSRLPAVQAAFRRTKIDTQNTMKRLSKSNILSMARQLAKTAFPSPGVVFKVALGQIEAYSNFIEAFVECARYFTPLGYDVLVWSLMIALGGSNRSRTQESSVLLTGKWLQALSKFSGKVFRRYHNLDVTPLLYYVNKQLFDGNSTDLIILKELITSMTGIVSDVDFTDGQIAAMTGGEVLRERTLRALQDTRYDATTFKCAKRLVQALVDSRIAGELLVNLAQFVQAAMFNLSDDQAHIKFLANTVDEALQTLQLYLDMLRHHLTPEQFDSLVPDITKLLSDFGLAPRLAFDISRASIAAKLHAKKVLPPLEQQPTADGDGDIPMDDKDSSGSSPDPTQADGETGAPAPSVVNPNSQAKQRADMLLEVLKPIINITRDIFPDGIWDRISPEFFVMFWSLHLSDMAVPSDTYSQAIERCKSSLDAINKDRSRSTRLEDRKAQKEELMAKMNALIEENKAHVSRTITTRNALSAMNEGWFVGEMAKVNLTANTLMEHCLMPRLLLSSTDADFCYKFVRSLHDLRAINFTLKALFDAIFCTNRLRSILFTCTVREAQNLGRFLKQILADLARWHASKTIYEKQALGPRRQEGTEKPVERKNWPFLGFATEFDKAGYPEEFVDHGHFQVLLFGWHKNLNMALKMCLAGSEWMHIRNAITVLKAVAEYFPAIDFMGKQFMEQLKTIHQREDDSKPASASGQQPRGDLSVAARTTSAELIKKQSKWVIVQAFRPSLNGETQEDSHTQNASSAPQSTAPELQAGSASTSGNSNNPSSMAEEGELRDGITSSRPSKPQLSDQSPSLPRTGPPSRPTSTNRGPASKSDSQGSKGVSGISSMGNNNRSEVPKLPTSLPNKPTNLPSRPNVPFPDHQHHSHRFPQSSHSGGNFGSHPAHPNSHGSRDFRGEARERERSREHRSFEGPRMERPGESPHARAADPPPIREPVRSSDRDFQSERNYPPPHAARFDRPPLDRHGNDRPPANDRDPRSMREPPLPPLSRPSEHRNLRELGTTHDARTSREQTRSREFGNESRSRDSHTSESRTREHAASQLATSTDDTPGPMINPERRRLLGLGDSPKDRQERPGRREPSNSLRSSRPSGPPEQQPPKSPKEDSHERHSSRHQSPRPDSRTDIRDVRGSDPGKSEMSGRDERSRRQPGSGIRDNTTEFPARYRSERESNRGTEKFRDVHSDSPQNRAPPRDVEPGRLSYNDTNYSHGRLNPIQSVIDMGHSDIPSGPRGRGARNSGRVPPPHPSNPQVRSDSRYSVPDGPRAASPERFPPTGPASSRISRRGPPGQPELGPTNSPSVPLGPTGTDSTTHPDRRRQISTNKSSDRIIPQGPLQPSPRSQVPPHRPMPNDINLQRPRHGTHTPTGPSSGNQENAPAKRHLHNLLANMGSDQANRSNMRRSQPRGSLPDSDAQVLTTGASPVSTPIHERPEPYRRDAGHDGPQGPRNSATSGSNHSGRGDDSERNRRERDGENRLPRPSHRSSREHSPHREREGKDREHRDRDRRPARDMEREPSSRRSMRESGREPFPGSGSSSREMAASVRDMSGRHRDSGRDSGREHRIDGRNEGSRTDGRGEDWGTNNRGSVRGIVRPSDSDHFRESREERGNRKRRSVESQSNPEREKRIRR